ncbi:type II toxin-antitoxin system VapC family toxin [Sphingomonas sp. HF-S4]|uniref:Type II toxin-antitoxin system VapC family toxin n=1 Tax=Sphingomonas agrestis TaxID=3080540 RepID=A0ABU3YCY1_9SPHN|nr:type II toxin-antitoxin system VapC family toxin [Sphingomonas sp. HF-S4]MDV3459249.1 type II toxin-antitoxin system VapC family toxin [Sphingomonas sp. HF-S4]
MQVLVDTHALMWWWANDARLSQPARAVLEDDANTVYASAASALEMSIKVRLGKLPEMTDKIDRFEQGVREDGFHLLPIRHDHAVRAGLMPGDHRDPFDRVLAAQGLIDELVVLTRDREIAAFGCKVLW